MMCPVCLSTLAMIAAGATSTGGLAAIAANTIAANVRPHATSSSDSEGNDHV